MDSDTAVSRRRMLVTAGTSVAALTAGSGVAAAQDNGSDGGGASIAVPGIIPETGSISADEDYTGFLLKLDDELDVSYDGIESCSAENWSPSDPRAFNAKLVDTVNAGAEDSYEVIPSSVALPQDTEFTTGDLFVVNNQSTCSGGGFLNVQMENVRSSEGRVRYNFTRESDPGSGDGSGAIGPGFGPVAALGGVLGGAYALARRGRSDGD
ncbi:hypothetical protein [Halomarina oriensis]|uniref:Uncharacterized protein n=1 Tax=Halomarina oriensis TaxID=671145 RepID=A0A6B0GML0_9EURY|nr:hypothetical protein [Halomarina oriensis]MWG34719.1 hypothetical protein [Halomarina oriensis]